MDLELLTLHIPGTIRGDEVIGHNNSINGTR